MTVSTPPPSTAAPGSAPDGVRHRDAANTRRLLLEAARRRFAQDGYAATTVRDIAAEAGVNVALINRYFTSKEGLFGACLASAASELDREQPEDPSLDQMVRTLVEQVVDPTDGQRSLQLLLLLRSSGDERADRIRRTALESITRRMAASVGWSADLVDTPEASLRAQLALSMTLGLVLLRSTGGMEPLTSASAEQLAAPLGEALAALLPTPGTRPGR